MKVAIVCDWLTGIGGAERVVLQLHKMFPDAPIYTSQYDATRIDWFKDADVRTGWLQKLPKGLKKFLPVLRARYFSHLDLSDYDLVISSSGAEAKAVKTGVKTKHICYCHSPTQYYWVRYNEYLQNPGFGFFDPLARLGLKLLVGPMKRWDYKAAQRPTYFVTNSNYTKANIKKYYGRDARVIFPPVQTARLTDAPLQPRSGFMTAGRQTPYKNIGLAVEACTKLGVPLLVVGEGPEHEHLTKLAGPSVTFKTGVNDTDMAMYFRSANAFIFPNADDFGIVAVEAMAAGTPVIALKAGGALDTVIEGKSGLFFDEPTVESLSGTIQRFDVNTFDEQSIISHADSFSPEAFRAHMNEYVSEVMK